MRWPSRSLVAAASGWTQKSGLPLRPAKRIVAGVNLIKRHTKPNPARNVAGGIVEREAAIHVSNVMLFNPVAKKGDRVGFRVLEDGRKVRYFKSDNEVVDV